MTTKALTAFAVLALAVCSTGCMKRTLIGFEDHPKQPYTAVELLEEHNNWIFGTTVEHRFVMCKDSGNQIVCSRSCGGAKEIECPKGALTTLAASSNVR